MLLYEISYKKNGFSKFIYIINKLILVENKKCFFSRSIAATKTRKNNKENFILKKKTFPNSKQKV